MRALRQRIASFENVEEHTASDDAAPRRKTKRRKRKKPSIATHPIFVPALAIWGACLGGLSVLVLPAPIVTRIAMVTGTAGFAGNAKFIIAALAAILFAAVTTLCALAYRRAKMRSANSSNLVSKIADQVQPIDPASELGSDSLDAPLDDAPVQAPSAQLEDDPFVPADEIAQEQSRGPTLGELAKRGYEDEPQKQPSETSSEPLFTRRHFQNALAKTCEGMADEEQPTPEQAPIQAPKQAAAEKRQDISLEEFGNLEGRDAVWVQEAAPADDPADDSAKPLAAKVARDAPSAIEHLRNMPTGELSLVQMVERFAAALHDYQDAERKRPGTRRSPRRDAALAEALKALTILTEGGPDFPSQIAGDKAEALRDTTRELRDALAKLQTLSGAA